MTPQDHNYSKQKSSTESSDSDVAKESDNSQQDNVVTSSQETTHTEESESEQRQRDVPSSVNIVELVASSTSDEEEMAEVSKNPDATKGEKHTKTGPVDAKLNTKVEPQVSKLDTKPGPEVLTPEESCNKVFDCSYVTDIPGFEMECEDVTKFETTMEVDSDDVTYSGAIKFKEQDNQSLVNKSVTAEKEVHDLTDLTLQTSESKLTSEGSIKSKVTEISDVKVSSDVTVRSDVQVDQGVKIIPKSFDQLTDSGAPQVISKQPVQLNDGIKDPNSVLKDTKDTVKDSKLKSFTKFGNVMEPIVITDTESSVTGSSAEEEGEDESIEEKKETTGEMKSTQDFSSKHSCQVEISAEPSSEVQFSSKEAKPSSPKSEDKDVGKTDTPKETVSGDKDENVRKDLIEKCIRGLELCIVRYPTHYKTLYRLAHIYYSSPFHKVLTE